MKVEAKSAKHVINIASEATSKNNVQGISSEIEGNWDRVWILMAAKRLSMFAYFTPVSKQKRSNETDSNQGLVDDIERKTFCDYIVEMLILQYRSKVSYHPLARWESRLERRDSRL